MKSRARNHLCGRDGRAGGLLAPVASSIQPPPNPIVGADLAGRLAAAALCHQSAGWGLRGDGTGVLGTMERAGGTQMCQGMGIGMGRLVPPRPGEGRAWERSPVLGSENRLR